MCIADNMKICTVMAHCMPIRSCDTNSRVNGECNWSDMRPHLPVILVSCLESNKTLRSIIELVQVQRIGRQLPCFDHTNRDQYCTSSSIWRRHLLDCQPINYQITLANNRQYYSQVGRLVNEL